MNKSVIEMHSTWLAINSIVGCTNGCKYCFLQTTNKNLSKPCVKVSPESAIKELLESKYYNASIPICLLPNTDAFLNKTNIEYLKKLILEIKKNKIPNTLTIVTKCYIDESFISFIKDIGMDKQIVFYLSYSGLGRSIEPNVNPENIKKNFVTLSKNDIRVVHYFRPLIPNNSKKEKIDEILDYVSDYTDYSVITGLKVKEEYFDKIDFWDELKKYKDEVIKAEGVWVEEAFDYFYKNYDRQHFIFQTNACALSSILGNSCLEYYDSYECKNYNLCSSKQREKCKRCNSRIDNDIKTALVKELIKLGKFNDQINIKIGDEIVIENAHLDIADLAYLTYVCHKKVTSTKKNETDNYFNSSLSNSKPLILGRKMKGGC